MVLHFSEKLNPRCCHVGSTCSGRLHSGEQVAEGKTAPGLPEKVLIAKRFFLADGCAALLLPLHQMKCWVCKSVCCYPGYRVTGTPHVACGTHWFCGLGDNMWLRLPPDETIQSTGGLGTMPLAKIPPLCLTDVNEKFTLNRGSLEAPCICCPFSYHQGKQAGFVVHGSALIYTDVPLFKEEILGYSDLRSAPRSHP